MILYCVFEEKINGESYLKAICSSQKLANEMCSKLESQKQYKNASYDVRSWIADTIGG